MSSPPSKLFGDKLHFPTYFRHHFHHDNHHHYQHNITIRLFNSGVWSSTNGGCHHQNFGDKLLFPLMGQWRHPFCKNLLHHNIFIRFFPLPDQHSIHDYLRDQAININEFTSLCTNLIRSELGIPYKVTLNVCFLESSFYSEPYFVWILFILFIYENNTFLNNYFQQIRKWFWPKCSWIILVR